MFLAADVGNSNIVIAVHDGNSWTNQYRYETKANQPGLFYETGLRDILFEWGIPMGKIKKVGLSSVVPELNQRLSQALLVNTGVEAFILSPEVFINMDLSIPKVYQIGSDLVSNAYCAIKKYQRDCIIVDFGTALTFMPVSLQKGILGVTIAPGLKTAMSALSINTAQLPEVHLDLPTSVIGHDTSTAIKSGVLYGYIGLVKEILSRVKTELKGDYFVVATGGLSSKLPDLHPLYDVIDKELTLDGIRLITEDHQ